MNDKPKKFYDGWTGKQWAQYHRNKRKRALRKLKTDHAARKDIQQRVVDKFRSDGFVVGRGRPDGPGIGTREGDIWRPEDHEPRRAESVQDERFGKTFCRYCKAEVVTKETDEGWVTCNPDDSLHECDGRDSDFP